MHLGILTTSYPRHAEDWAGHFVAELSGWLADHGDCVEVLAPEPARSVHPAVKVRPLRYARKPCLFYGAGAPDNLLDATQIWHAWRAWSQVPAFVGRLAVACALRSRSWQGVISHWLIPSGLVGAGSASSLPHLAIAHSSDVHLLRRIPGARRLLARIARGRSALVLTSELLRAHLLTVATDRRTSQWVEDAVVSPMGVRAPPASDPALERRARAVLGTTDDLPIVLFVGRLVPVKGLDRLLRSAQGMAARVVVVGDGPQRERLSRLADSLGVRAHFVGEQDRPTTWAWMRLADLLVLPSVVLADGRTDSAPAALLEAMAIGLPVVASGVGGVGDIVEDGVSGLIAEPGNVDALRVAITALLSRPPVRHDMGRAAQLRVQRFHWDQIGARLRGIIERL